MNPTSVLSPNRDYLAAVCNRAGSWFYWIAGVTAVVVIIDKFGANIVGLIGLFLPTYFALDRSMGATATIIAIVTGVIGAGIFGGLGFFAARGAMWAFIVGIVFYVIDGALFGIAQDWLAVALHAYALFGVFRGVGAAKQLTAIRAAERQAATQAQPIGAWYSAPPAGAVVAAPVIAEPSAAPPSDPVS